ncbi:MAG TPA: glutamine-hydrolyzing carbamoyl-phosphate synthase small subunit [Kofleriaceae bacterium]|nr:glutamine-hydrolyzing carbamoyl-phosphate synthase small subunit [Kofleriaceae bacterium]
MSGGRPAVLVLASGRVFRGRSIGAVSDDIGPGIGEVVFNTSLTGYQEILTDPSYAGQIVLMTAPQIGNTGINIEDLEALRPHCAGFIVRESSPVASSWRSEGDLDGYLRQHGIPGLEGIDTRALTRALREGGVQRGVISASQDVEALRAAVLAAPEMEGQDLVPAVTCAEPYEWDHGRWVAPDLPAAPARPIEHHVVAYDFGIKRNILRDLRNVGCRVTVVPATTSARDVLALEPDGVFLSNGPGDPAAVTYAIEAVGELVSSGRPVFGICLGHQILSLALGARTYKLRFGHHGGNHPVQDLLTGKVEITSQNHGFAVDRASLPDRAECTHLNLYDDTVEGVRLLDRPVFSVQYHPEASPGPHDASYLFERFIDTMRAAKR